MATKDTYYFKHDSNARNDIKLIKVRRKYQMEGYGIYFAILEILREQSDYKLPVADIEDVAFDLSIPVEIITSIINDFGLFVIEKGMFFSASFLRRMEAYDDLKAKRVAAGSKGGKASVKQNESKPKAKKKQTLSDAQALDYTILDYTKEDYSKVEKTKEIILSGFDFFWKVYQKPIDRKKCFDKFSKIELSEWQKLFTQLPEYVAATPEVQFRKNPLTYLNGRCWEDEVINTNKPPDARILQRKHFYNETEYLQYCTENKITPEPK